LLFRSLKEGIKDTFRNSKLLALLYIVNLLFAIVITIPFKNILTESFSRVKASETLISNFSFTAFVDFLSSNGAQLRVVFSYLLPIGFLYLILNLFLSGGILSIWRTDIKIFDKNIFFGNCAEYFFKFIKIFLLIIILILIVCIVCFILFGVIDSINESVYSSDIANLLILLCAGVMLFFISICILIYDYARIILVKDVVTKSTRSVFYSIRFILKNFFGVYCIFLSVLLLLIISSVIFVALKLTLPINNWSIFLVLFIIQQIYILLRIALRVILYSSQFIYYENKI
jgi:hypothetical protein